jgi:hypothetical protein
MITYNPKEIDISFAGVPIESLADGTFCKVTPNEDSISIVKGIDGKTAYFKMLDFDATVEITLLQNSASDISLRVNYVQAQQDSDVRDNVGSFPLTITDNKSGQSYSSNSVRILRSADVTFADGSEGRTWTFYCENLTTKILPTSPAGLLSSLLKSAKALTSNISGLANTARTFFG